VNDICALAALKVWDEVGASDKCAVISQNAILEARNEMRRPGTRLVGSVAYFPERYGNQVVPLALSILQKKPVVPAVFVRHQLITPRNVDLVYPLDEAADPPVLTKRVQIASAAMTL
jgi:ribose transport system substrate-binding protein